MRCMRRPLSTLERLIDGNVCYLVEVQGEIAAEGLRRALDAVQAKHPALRMAMCETRGGPVYAFDAAPPVPLRVLERGDADADALAEADVRIPFAPGQPQLRIAWLRGVQAHALAFTTTHRVCDGMSLLTIVRETLGALCGADALVPYPPFDVRDIIAAAGPARAAWRLRLAAAAVNTGFALLPPSSRPTGNDELHLRWKPSPELADALQRGCRERGVAMHAALLAALCRSLPVLQGRTPDRIECPVDARRGRLPALRDDALFFGGGSFRVAARREAAGGFWDEARALDAEVRAAVERDVARIPDKYRFCEMVRPPSPGRLRRIVQLGDRFSLNGNWNLFSFSNLGRVRLLDPGAPLRATRLRVFVHSYSVRLLGLIAHALDGRLRFDYVGDRACLDAAQAQALGQRLLQVLANEAGAPAPASVGDRSPAAGGAPTAAAERGAVG